MKKSNLIAAFGFIAMLVFLGCNEEQGNGILDPDATIKIRPAEASLSNSPGLRSSLHLTGLEIVKLTDAMYFRYENTIFDRGFHALQRDTVEPCLMMYGTDIIDQQGNYHPRFIESTDCVLIRIHDLNQETEWIDTIAYVPNDVLHAAQVRIKAAYDVQDYNTCYQLFDSAFVFIPISGPEWRELKALGLE